MNRTEFLKVLEAELKGFPASERAEIISDYAEHFEAGKEQGRTEEAVAEALGNPVVIAKQYRASQVIVKAEKSTTAVNTFRAVIAVVGLGFFNLFFILTPFLFAASMLFACFTISGGFLLTGPLLIIGRFMPAISIPVFLVERPVALISLSLGITSFGLLAGIASVYLARWFFKGTLWYLKTNIKLITGGSN